MTAPKLDLGSNAGAIATRLDVLSLEDRIASVLSLTPSDQKTLWQIVSDAPGRGGVLVEPASDGATQAYAGRNSLGMLSRFEKRFFRAGASTFGYNSHPLQPLIGPGYFGVTARDGGGYRFDYRALPDRSPAGWPGVRPNDRFPARAVYGDLTDVVLWVSRDVLVGAAYRGGDPLDSYFVLARLPGASRIGQI